jgi:translocation protein SEC63
MQGETLEALGAEAKVVEDDISEPDEDSIAGQMAVLRGQPVRRIADDEDDEDEDGSEDDTSGSESGFEWTETTASEDED